MFTEPMRRTANRAANALWIAMIARPHKFSSYEAGFIWRIKCSALKNKRPLSDRQFSWLSDLAKEKCLASDYVSEQLNPTPVVPTDVFTAETMMALASTVNKMEREIRVLRRTLEQHGIHAPEPT